MLQDLHLFERFGLVPPLSDVGSTTLDPIRNKENIFTLVCAWWRVLCLRGLSECGTLLDSAIGDRLCPQAFVGSDHLEIGYHFVADLQPP